MERPSYLWIWIYVWDEVVAEGGGGTCKKLEIDLALIRKVLSTLT